MSKTILIVEDEKDLSEALDTSLSYEGYQVRTAPDGEAGLAVAKEVKPDLIMLDIAMPKMNGKKMLAELRTTDWGKNVKVLVLTAVDDMESLADVMEQGTVEYVLKTSATLGEIVAKVKKHLGEPV